MSVPTCAVRRGLAALAVTAAVAASGQFADRVEVAIGTVQVAVLDRAGRPVGGIAPGDFSVSVDGITRTIVHVSPCAPPGATEPSLPSVEGRPVPPPLPPGVPVDPEGSLLVIVVDNGNIAPFDRNHLLSRVSAWLGDRLKPPDRAMVVALDTDLRIVCPPTSDANEVARVVGAELGRSTAMAGIYVEAEIAERQIRDLASSPRNLDQAMALARFHAIHMRDHVRRTVGMLASLISSLSGLPGRRDLLYLSDGLPMVPGAELYVLIDELWGGGRRGVVGGQAYAETAQGYFTDLAALANRSSVTVHAIDARGLVVASGTDASRRYERGVSGASRVGLESLHNTQDPLLLVADETGGVAVVDSNQFDRALARVADAVDRCTSIAFSLDGVAVDVPHRVRVQLAHGEAYTLRYRSVIVPRSHAGVVADRTVANLAFPPDENPLGVTLALGTAEKVSRKRWRVPITVTVPLDKVVLLPAEGGKTATFTLFVVARDTAGLTSDVQRERHTVTVPADEAGGVAALRSTAEIGRVGITISVGVIDEAGLAAGYARADLPPRH